MSLSSSLDPSLPDIGFSAVWTLSSAKPGNGIEQLRDGNLSSFWQSDGPSPHLITIQFPYKVAISVLAFYTDYKLDESYTPACVAVRAGTSLYDLEQVMMTELEEPVGWTSLKMEEKEKGKGYRATVFQLAILSSHQSGRDTHIRQMKILAPAKENVGNSVFTTVQFQSQLSIR